MSLSKYDYFLFLNHKNEGILEDLLQKILCEPKSERLNCARNYHECLAKNGKFYDKKQQWNFITRHLIKDKSLDLGDEATWFIDENPYLQPLIKFLDEFFKENLSS